MSFFLPVAVGLVLLFFDIVFLTTRAETPSHHTPRALRKLFSLLCQKAMALPLVLVTSANDKSNQAAKVAATIVGVAYFVLFVLAIYLAIRDMQFLPHTSTKIWVLVLAFFFPDLYVLLHGISSSAQGVGFFAGSPMPGGGMGSAMPTMSPTLGAMTGLTPESTMS